jgi:GMP synthase (glutamine-hydrolysing)
VSSPRLLIIQHEDDCPPAWFGEWFHEAGIGFHVVRGHRNEVVPDDLEGYTGLVVLGGEMGAYDDAEYPWLTPTKALIAHAVRAEVWFLGICLGHQLAAVALGGEVSVNPRGQATGLTAVQLTPQGRVDELTGVIADTACSIQWNSDIVSRLPDGSQVLATAPDESVQAARFGPRAWGVQFHPEASPALFNGWVRSAAPLAEGDGHDLSTLAGQLFAAEAQLRRDWAALAKRWVELVTAPLLVP